jgi:hypothetical protein
MAHFAKVFNGIVTNVIVAEPEFFETFVDNSPGEWVQTSYNTSGGIHYNSETKLPSLDQSKALRKNYAGVGYVYDRIRDAFYAPQPYPSWVLNEDTCIWNPPVPYPEDYNSKFYKWNEESLSWDEIEIPE